MPIDLHMEAVPQDMPFPPERRGGANPENLKANIAAFERLLAHNRDARIVWLHAGWDLTGLRTTGLMEDLLRRHPNLAMNIKADRIGTPASGPFGPDGKIKPAWLAMLQAFPDRFAIGSDEFAGDGVDRFTNARRLIDQLPSDLTRRVGHENARRLYRLPPR